MTNHRYFAPSSADKWINCSLAASGEARIVEQYGEEPAKPHMLEGTEAHARGEHVLKAPGNPIAEVLSDRYTPEEREYLLPYVRAVWEDIDMLEAKLLVEETFGSHMDGRLGGTPDAVVYSLPERTLVVTDYKHGVNVFVDADTLQLQIYGHLVAAKLGPENFDLIVLRVVQPRHRSGAEPVREHHITDVDTWYQEFRKTLLDAINASDKNPEPTTGDHCMWCKVAPTCPGHMSDIDDVLGVDISKLDLEVEEDFDKIRMILDAEKSINAAIKQAKSLATRLIDMGYQVPGYGLKDSIGNREWVSDSDDKIARALRSRGLDKSLVWIKKLISPTQADKNCDLGGKFCERYITRKSKGKRLTKLKPGEASATETAKEKLENYEMTESEKALVEGF